MYRSITGKTKVNTYRAHWMIFTDSGIYKNFGMTQACKTLENCIKSVEKHMGRYSIVYYNYFVEYTDLEGKKTVIKHFTNNPKENHFLKLMQEEKIQ